MNDDLIPLLQRISEQLEELLEEKRSGKRLLSQKEAARILGTSPTTLCNMRIDGRIKGVPVGKRWKYPAEEVSRVRRGQTRKSRI